MFLKHHFLDKDLFFLAKNAEDFKSSAIKNNNKGLCFHTFDVLHP